MPQDPGQAGKSKTADMVLMLAGNVVKAERESGDKLRAEPVAAQAEAGDLDILETRGGSGRPKRQCDGPR